MERIFGEPQAGPSGILATPRIMPPKPTKLELVVKEPKPQANMEKCLLANREMKLPISLIEDVSKSSILMWNTGFPFDIEILENLKNWFALFKLGWETSGKSVENHRKV